MYPTIKNRDAFLRGYTLKVAVNLSDVDPTMLSGKPMGPSAGEPTPQNKVEKAVSPNGKIEIVTEPTGKKKTKADGKVAEMVAQMSPHGEIVTSPETQMEAIKLDADTKKEKLMMQAQNPQAPQGAPGSPVDIGGMPQEGMPQDFGAIAKQASDIKELLKKLGKGK